MPDVFIDRDKKQDTIPHVQHQKSGVPTSRISILGHKPQKPGIFSAFAALPPDTTFENQEPDEKILLLLRRHFITNVPWILTAVFFLLLPLLVLPFLTIPFQIPPAYGVVLTIFYYLIIFGYVLTQFATWYYQLGIITTYRVIDIDFHSLLGKNIAYTELADIVDVEATQGGVLQNIFNYGNVQIQTEGLKPNFEFLKIPKPTTVADTISDLMRERRSRG